MLKWILPVLLATLYSCASISADWSSWKITTVAQVKQNWRICTADKDGPDLHLKGFCYQSQECRSRNPWYSGEKKECRRLTLSCLWGDVECIVKYGLPGKILVTP